MPVIGKGPRAGGNVGWPTPTQQGHVQHNQFRAGQAHQGRGEELRGGAFPARGRVATAQDGQRLPTGKGKVGEQRQRHGHHRAGHGQQGGAQG